MMMILTRNIIADVQPMSTQPWNCVAGSGLVVSEKKLSRMLRNPPYRVFVPRKLNGRSVTHAYFSLPILIIRLVPTHSATVANNWLAMPNIGHMVDTLPVHKK